MLLCLAVQVAVGCPQLRLGSSQLGVGLVTRALGAPQLPLCLLLHNGKSSGQHHLLGMSLHL